MKTASNIRRQIVSIVVLTVLLLASWPLTPLQAQSPEDQWLDVLSRDASVAEKCTACRQLQAVASEKAVAPLAALLIDADISHTARMALEVMPYPTAAAVLRDAAGSANGLTKAGILDSLGERRDQQAVALLTAALNDSDAQVRLSAAAALGKIGGTAATDALRTALTKAEGNEQSVLALSLVRCADSLKQAGQTQEAATIFQSLTQEDQTPKVRLAAFRGLLQSDESAAAQQISQALQSDTPQQRQAAAGLLHDLSAAAFSQVASELMDMPSDAQIAVLAAVRIRGDRSQTPLVLKAADSSDPNVQMSAVQALGAVGDLAALPRLIEVSSMDGRLGQLARESLQIVCDPRVDTEIAKRLSAEQDVAQRAQWIELVEARRSPGAVTLLLKEASYSDAQVRRRAMDALADLAGPQNLKAMATAVLQAEKGGERDNAEKAVMLVSRHIQDSQQQAASVIDVFQEARDEDQVSLLPLLGRIGGTAALEKIQSALKSSNAERYEAGVRALCNWPDASVAEQMLELTEQAASPAHRLWALRAFIRVIALPSDMSDAKKLELLQQGMARAERDAECNLVLQRASAIRTVEALRFLLPYLDQSSLAQTAGASITELARHTDLRDPHETEFVTALEKVLKTNQDHGVLERARRYIQAANEN